MSHSDSLIQSLYYNNILSRKSQVRPHRALAELENVAGYGRAAVAEQALEHGEYHQLQTATVHLDGRFAIELAGG